MINKFEILQKIVNSIHTHIDTTFVWHRKNKKGTRNVWFIPPKHISKYCLLGVDNIFSNMLFIFIQSFLNLRILGPKVQMKRAKRHTHILTYLLTYLLTNLVIVSYSVHRKIFRLTNYTLINFRVVGSASL